MNSRLHHVGVIVPDEEQMRNLMALLGLKEGRRYYIAEYQAECVFTEGENGVIEFILPRDGKLSKFNKGMGGLHHIALQVECLEKASAELKAKGIELLEPHPVNAGPIRINFLPPVYTRGVIVELVEPSHPS